MNNIFSNQSTNVDYDIAVLLPKILGDSMMSVHALRCYPDFYKEAKVLIVTESVYKNLFKIIFNDHTVKSYSEILGVLTAGNIIDFRGDETSKLIKGRFTRATQHTKYDFP